MYMDIIAWYEENENRVGKAAPTDSKMDTLPPTIKSFRKKQTSNAPTLRLEPVVRMETMKSVVES